MLMNRDVKSTNMRVREKSELRGFYKENEVCFLNCNFDAPDSFFSFFRITFLKFYT